MLYRNRKPRLTPATGLASRSAAAVIEAAIALPLVLIVILGTVEVCNGIFLKQSLLLMAFEGARVAVIPEATLEDVKQQVEMIGEQRGVKVERVEVRPADFANSNPGAFIEVVITSSASQPGRTRLFAASEMTASVHIMKELE